MSDGGCKTSGDVCKAMCAGADFVMIGGMFAGTEECEGDWEYHYKCNTKEQKTGWQSHSPDYPTEKRKVSLKFYGMSSHYAQEKHGSGKKKYRASEGKCVKIAYRGDINNTIKEILGGIRSTCTYIGAKNIEEMSEKTTFIKVNRTINNIFGN